MDYRNLIGIHKNYFDPKPSFTCQVADFCLNVQNGDYQEEVEAVRKLSTKDERDKIKATLPAATLSGTFTERKGSALVKHSGFICVDLDAKGNPNVNNWGVERDKLMHIKNVFFAAKSVSGQGLFLLIPITQPERHRAHFDQLIIDMAKHNYAIDKSCRDVSRLRGMSYDPDARFNYEAVPYDRIYTPKKRAPRQHDKEPDIAALEKWLSNKGEVYVEGNRNNYLFQLSAACARTNVPRSSIEQHIDCRYNLNSNEVNSILKSAYT